MKYLVLILVVVAVLWLLRANRRPPPPTREKSQKAKLPRVEDMVSCAQCGLHLPHDEALPGRGGFFCCDAHRAAHEKLNAPR